MHRVLVVIGTGGHFDTIDLCEGLKEKGVECTVTYWNTITIRPGEYGLAVLLGLTEYRDIAHRYASTVRAAIGSDTKLLVVSHWSRSVMAAVMKEHYNAEYELRSGPILNLVDTAMRMLGQTKPAP